MLPDDFGYEAVPTDLECSQILADGTALITACNKQQPERNLCEAMWKLSAAQSDTIVEW